MGLACILAFEVFDPAVELKLLSGESPGIGAVASFTGLARPKAPDGTTVRSMFLDHHPRLTQQSLDDIGAAAADRFDIVDLKIVHRCGTIGPGEPIVFVGASATHRRAAIEAVDYMMDRLKTEAYFWKQERRDDGSQWIEPSAADYQERERWTR